ncbi:unnamed protein product [Urochloa decumbens]|uniref:Uncharacterized protein n=1 Tax=Urochloa decumbens TaxID=240449 RepID=A0ABC8YUJ6_9POAL
MGMEAPPAPTAGNKKQPPPALFLVRARSRASRVADLDDSAAAAAWSSPGPPDTPPRRSPVTVPFLWEDAPGKPKGLREGPRVGAAVPSDAGAGVAATAAAATTPAAAAGDHAAEEAPLPAPLKLPPRLQRVASARQQRQRDDSLSPKAALHGHYYYYGCAGGGGKRPPARRTASGLAAFRRAPSFGASFFSRSGKSRVVGGGHLSGAAAPADAPWCSPAASSASSMSSSSSSLSASCFGDDHGQGGHRRPVDGREDVSSEEDECAVRITRFRRNRSFPSMTKSHLWASIRKSVKQITPWS